ncbi:hypothetical protein AAC387_Pa07g3268 [Persea americana]
MQTSNDARVDMKKTRLSNVNTKVNTEKVRLINANEKATGVESAVETAIMKIFIDERPWSDLHSLSIVASDTTSDTMSHLS